MAWKLKNNMKRYFKYLQSKFYGKPALFDRSNFGDSLAGWIRGISRRGYTAYIACDRYNRSFAQDHSWGKCIVGVDIRCFYILLFYL
jgi:hypothetical protein